MTPLRYPIIVIAVIIGGWLVFDGSRALIKGDYVTPQSGPSAGQLGPWSRVVAALGIAPRGTFMKCLHLVLGILWLISAGYFVFCPPCGRTCLLITSIGTLWYLP